MRRWCELDLARAAPPKRKSQARIECRIQASRPLGKSHTRICMVTLFNGFSLAMLDPGGRDMKCKTAKNMILSCKT